MMLFFWLLHQVNSSPCVLKSLFPFNSDRTFCSCLCSIQSATVLASEGKAYVKK
uniref:Uncharacterized protein n=1 Tax=Rhizophora mucronata TaxID=61149 RepID=A0A2P2QVV2_RHIMU